MIAKVVLVHNNSQLCGFGLVALLICFQLLKGKSGIKSHLS